MAARREVEEEAGLHVTTEHLVAICDIGYLMVFVFVGRVVAGTEWRQPEEIAELHWFRQDELEHEAVFNVVPLLVAALRNGQDGLEPGLSLQMVRGIRHRSTWWHVQQVAGLGRPNVVAGGHDVFRVRAGSG